jgi:hypothetical protein
MNRRPPAFATWLLERFGVKRQNEALMGDLAEEYQAGQSRMWYWWQTLVAIWATAVRDIRAHKLLALRALTMAWALDLVLPRLHQKVLMSLIAPYYYHGGPSLLAVLHLVNNGELLLQALLFGWLIARAHRAHAAAMVLLVAASRPFIAMSYGIYFPLAGWNVFRGYHDQLEWILLSLAGRVVLILAGGLLARPKIGPEQPSATTAHAIS